MAGDDRHVVGKGEEGIVDGFKELPGVSSGKVGAADGAGEESISGKKKRLLGEVEADAAFGVAGCVQDRAC